MISLTGFSLGYVEIHKSYSFDRAHDHVVKKKGPGLEHDSHLLVIY